MKQFKRHIGKDGGEVVLVAEDAEDMWHVYNLVAPGDTVRTSTLRKVTSETATGSTQSQRVQTTLTVLVEAVEYDATAGKLHLKGRNVAENAHVKMGAYHTLDIELNKRFTLHKTEWDCIHFDRLNMAIDPAQRADLAAVVMHEGLANVCLITNNMTICRAKIDYNIPRKRKGMTEQHDKAMGKFFDQVAAAVQKHVNFDIVRCCLIASPGFVRDAFLRHLMQWAEKNGAKPIVDNRSKLVLVHSSSGFKHALNQVLADPSLVGKLADTKAQSEVKALEAFHQMLADEPFGAGPSAPRLSDNALTNVHLAQARAYYGLLHVERAAAANAIDTLLLADSLFRSTHIATRKRYVRLVERTRDQAGRVLIFSSAHVSGEQLAQLTGVAAILRYPMPEIEDEIKDSDASSDSD